MPGTLFYAFFMKMHQIYSMSVLLGEENMRSVQCWFWE